MRIEIPYGHHERWDGSGYPHGLKGEEIPFAARIFAVVDVWDALSSDQPYRPAWDRQHIVRFLREQAGIKFDARVVEALLDQVLRSSSLSARGAAAWREQFFQPVLRALAAHSRAAPIDHCLNRVSAQAVVGQPQRQQHQLKGFHRNPQ